jgi:hypothetical protein
MAATTLAIAGLALSAVGTAGSFVQQGKQAKQQKKARNAQQAQQKETARRSRVQALREAQINRSRSVNATAATGGGFSSGIAGGVASQGSQTGQALGFSTQMSGLSDVISVANQKAADAAQLGAGFGAVANLGGSIFSNAGKISGALGGGTGQQAPSSPFGFFQGVSNNGGMGNMGGSFR